MAGSKAPAAIWRLDKQVKHTYKFKNKIALWQRTLDSLGLHEERGATRPGSTSSGPQCGGLQWAGYRFRIWEFRYPVWKPTAWGPRVWGPTVGGPSDLRVHIPSRKRIRNPYSKAA